METEAYCRDVNETGEKIGKKKDGRVQGVNEEFPILKEWALRERLLVALIATLVSFSSRSRKCNFTITYFSSSSRGLLWS